MLTSKQRSYLRGLAAKEDTILQIGKDGITENTTAALSDALRARELVKGRVLETAMMTPREVCDALCEATGAEGIQVVGSKFVIWRKSEKVEQEKKKAMNELKDEISGIAVDIASKVVEREIDEKDHEELISEFIKGVGEAS